MEENNNNYNYEPYRSSKAKHSFSKSVFVPFLSGAVGATLVVGTCFSIPSIKSKLIGVEEKTSDATSSVSEPAQTVTVNSNLVSLVDYSETSVSVAQKVLPSIVGINIEYQINSIFSSRASTATAVGSGVIISDDGYILTNNHVVSSSSSTSYYQVSEATKITVSLYNDKETYEAKVIGTDKLTDLAVIKIEKDNLTPAELGDSSALKIGEFVMALGNPLGLEFSVSCGVVSAVDRNVTDTDGKKYTLIQTDAAINSGNSGGALVNSKGQVIGLNTLKMSGSGVEGMGFAIPISSTTSIYKELIQYGKVKRPYIGIGTIDIDSQIAEYYSLPTGVYIKNVADFSPAQKAEIKSGDIILKINDVSVSNTEELNAEKNKYSIGDTINLTIKRDSEEIVVKVTLEEEPSKQN